MTISLTITSNVISKLNVVSCLISQGYIYRVKRCTFVRLFELLGDISCSFQCIALVIVKQCLVIVSSVLLLCACLDVASVVWFSGDSYLYKNYDVMSCDYRVMSCDHYKG